MIPAADRKVPQPTASGLQFTFSGQRPPAARRLGGGGVRGCERVRRKALSR